MANLSLAEVSRHLDRLAPTSFAERWDNVGLILGRPTWKTRGAIVDIDLTPESVKAARRKGFNLIVNHHPALFPTGKGIGRLASAPSDSLQSLLLEAAEHRIGVYACHTNFDRCALEVVREASKALGARPIGRLHDPSSDVNRMEFLKLVVFVPVTHVDQVRDSICAAGAGRIGNYDSCTFGSPGLGTFRGLKGTNPFLGRPGVLEFVEEVRFETILPRALRARVLGALREAHPYEEIAFDIYPVLQTPSEKGLVPGLGYGFFGDLETPLGVDALIRRVARIFKSKSPRLTGRPPRKIRRIGFVAGKGISFARAAEDVDCDLFITGEAGYHDAWEAARSGLPVLDLGHRESEIFFPKVMKSWLNSIGLK